MAIESQAAGFQQQDILAAVRQRQRQADAGRAAADDRQIGREDRVPGKGAGVLKGAQETDPLVAADFSPVRDVMSCCNCVRAVAVEGREFGVQARAEMRADWLLGNPPARLRAPQVAVARRTRPLGSTIFRHRRSVPIFASMVEAENGGAKRDRTADLLHAMQALSQLSYGPNSVAPALLVAGGA